MVSAADFDVVVVGFGPGGEVVASLLGQAGHRVLAIDKAHSPFGQPRMSTLDGEIARVLQHAADPAEAMEDAIPALGIAMWGADGQAMPPLDWNYKVSGHWSHYSLHQPNIESAMERRIALCPSVDVRWGCQAIGLEQSRDRVSLSVELTSSQDGEVMGTETITARYVLGFDGASSFVRQAAGIELDVLHEHQDRWILTDFDALRPLPDILQQTQFHMHPERLWFACPNGANRCRTDVRLQPGDDLTAELAEERGYAFLESHFGVTQADVKLTRRVAYRFRSHLAQTFRAGRVFIGGDAAHAMTPSMGQGACCAMRDAANLAWKLRLVLSGAADEALLDTYEPERRPQSEFFVRGSLATWEFASEADPVKAAERDAAARAGAIEFPPIPGLTAGVLHRDPVWFRGRSRRRLAPQGLVRREGRDGLVDDLVGYGGQLITTIAVGELLGTERLARLRELGVHVLRVGNDGDHGADIIDLDGTYRAFWLETGVLALLARPDLYLFGVAASNAELRDLVDDFVTQIPAPPVGLRSGPPSVPDTRGAATAASS